MRTTQAHDMLIYILHIATVHGTLIVNYLTSYPFQNHCFQAVQS